MVASRYQIKVEIACRLPELIAETSSLSISEVKQAMRKGAVWISDSKGTRRLRRPGNKAETGATVYFYHNADVLSQQVELPVLLADEDNYSIWIKPRGVLSHGSKWGDHCSITRLVESTDRKKRPAFLIHRLDRAATGLMIIGHGRKITRMFAALFAERKIRKAYHAIVAGRFSESREVVSFDKPVDGRDAQSFAQIIEYDVKSNRSLIKVTIDSGRKHQIRKHLSQAGFPIEGDRLYGGGSDKDLQLAAKSLGFQCPLSGEEKDYQLPEEYRPRL